VSDATRGDEGGSGADSEPDDGGQHDRDGARSGPETGADESDRHERVTAHPTPGAGNSLRGWYRHRNPLRVMVNYAVILVCRVSPSLRLKRWLLRRLGVTVGERVAWGLESTPDVFWPDLITVEDDAVIGYDATLLCHEFLVDEYRTGTVVVGEGAMVGAGAIVLPGVRVGEGARVAANSLVTEDVPPGATVAGVPAEVVSHEDDGDRQTA
jgi:acetyltransferase-like isoleucine patch superfamily enzyme